ncbi:MAG: helix-turn-helix transcriptional regulator [Promicromonosporaceae bacterium]|nr:helix-turn-helix transcriptional regulator [Promicromonosporaceae bacterium]
MLQELGLSAAAERLYIQLFKHPSGDSQDLQILSQMSATEVADNLTVLRALGIAMDAAVGVQVVSPAVATQILLEQQEAGLAHLQALIKRSQIAASKFVLEHQFDFKSDSNERIFGRDLVFSRIAQLAQETVVRMDTFAPGGNYPTENIEASHRADSEMFKRNVKSRAIYVEACLTFPHVVAHLEWLIAHKAEVRITPELPVRMIISDRKTAILPLDISNAMNGIVVVQDAGTVQALCALFDSKWQQSAEYGLSAPRATEDLSERDLVVLRLLAEALTDKQLAKRIGVKERTAQSAVETVRRKLGARNRFELGAIAAKEGLI